MRVLLVQHSRENDKAYPLGLGYVAAVLREEGHDVDFLDLALEEEEGSGILRRRAETGGAQAIGFTAITPQYHECIELVRKVKPVFPEIPFVMGGPHASALPEEVLRQDAADIIALSEGERIAPVLFRALEEGSNLRSVPGIAFLDRLGNFIQTSPAASVEDLDSLPYPPWDILHPRRYRGRLKGLKTAYVITSRGCPYHCTHCYRGPAGGRRFRQRSVENIMTEIGCLHRDYGMGAIAFKDDIFTLNMDHTKELCRALLAERSRVLWNCQTRVDRVDAELLRVMKRAGCMNIGLGVESGNDGIREKLGKKTSKEEILKAFRYCREAGITTTAFFMLGTPWETQETVEETVSFAKELKATINLFFLATPYPGTKLREEFVKAGWPVPDDYRGYRHFVTEKGSGLQGGTEMIEGPQAHFAGECRRATREILRAQVRDYRRYPELLQSYLQKYTLGEIIQRAVRGLTGNSN